MKYTSSNTKETCGSWLASDSGGSVKFIVIDRTSSLASQLPQGFVVFV
jgi:hypothetical protein